MYCKVLSENCLSCNVGLATGFLVYTVQYYFIPLTFSPESCQNFFEELPFKTIALSTYAENLAAGKPTTQSSTFPGGESEKAVDGNPDTEFNNGHCSHTKLDPSSSWWSVDLGSDNVLVYEVRIVNRFSQYNSIRQRSRNYIITLGEYFISSIFFLANN